MNLYLACGKKRLPGYVHVDISPACKPDVVFDLLDWGKRWPWQNVKSIVIEHFVEHIPHGDGKDGFVRFFERCWDVLRRDGTVHVTFPWYASIGAFSDPTHRRFITPLTFNYLSKQWLRDHGIDHYEMRCDYEVAKCEAKMAETMNTVPPEQHAGILWSTLNAAHEGVAELRALK